MSERVANFRVLMRDYGIRIPEVCDELLCDAAWEFKAQLAAATEFQRQLQTAKKRCAQLQQLNDKLAEANRLMTARLRDTYAEYMQMKTEHENAVTRYNMQRQKLIQVVNANDELAVEASVRSKGLAYILQVIATEEAQSLLTPEQKTELSRLTTESFSDQLREETRREMREKLKNK